MSTPAAARPAVTAFVHELVVAALNRDLHGDRSPHFMRAAAAAATSLRAAVRAGAATPLRIGVDGVQFVWCDEVLRGPSLQARTLLLRCAQRGVTNLAFAEDCSEPELQALLGLLLDGRHLTAFRPAAMGDALAQAGIRAVAVELDPRPAPTPASGAQAAILQYQELTDSLQQNHRLAVHDEHLAVDGTQGVVARALVQLDEEPSQLFALAAADDVDRFTVGHSVRVALLALHVARAAGVPRHRLVDVGTAAMLHDIGKSKVPQEILFKQGPLDEEEWLWMAQHPRLGAQILLEQPTLDQTAVGAAFCHHMGGARGYPEPAFAMQPSSISRLVRVCDVFEALTAQRPYKRALSPCEAYAVMFRHEGDFDPLWLRYFAKVIGLFPIGTSLQLDDGAEGIVVAHGPAADRPVVHLVTGPAGSALPADAPQRLTIGVPHEGRTPGIRAVLTNDRHVAVPHEEPGRHDWLTTTPAGACLGPNDRH